MPEPGLCNRNLRSLPTAKNKGEKYEELGKKKGYTITPLALNRLKSSNRVC